MNNNQNFFIECISDVIVEDSFSFQQIRLTLRLEKSFFRKGKKNSKITNCSLTYCLEKKGLQPISQSPCPRQTVTLHVDEIKFEFSMHFLFCFGSYSRKETFHAKAKMRFNYGRGSLSLARNGFNRVLDSFSCITNS